MYHVDLQYDSRIKKTRVLIQASFLESLELFDHCTELIEITPYEFAKVVIIKRYKREEKCDMNNANYFDVFITDLYAKIVVSGSLSISPHYHSKLHLINYQ